MNSIHLIIPYRWEGMWVFDDPRVGISKQPFVVGGDGIIDQMVANLSAAEDGFKMVFSENPFPGAMFVFDWVREESAGNWYFVKEFGKGCWLCPALSKYLGKFPATVFVKVGDRLRK